MDKPDESFCKDMGCGAFDPEKDKCGAIECPYPKDLWGGEDEVKECKKPVSG